MLYHLGGNANIRYAGIILVQAYHPVSKQCKQNVFVHLLEDIGRRLNRRKTYTIDCVASRDECILLFMCKPIDRYWKTYEARGSNYTSADST